MMRCTRLIMVVVWNEGGGCVCGRTEECACNILQPSTIIVCIVCGNSISDAVAIDGLLPSTHLKVSESKNCRVQHARRWFTSFLVNHSRTNLKPLSLTFGGYKLIKGCTIHGHLRLQSDMKYLKDIRLQCSYEVNLGH